jgi:hypothetical protein
MMKSGAVKKTRRTRSKVGAQRSSVHSLSIKVCFPHSISRDGTHSNILLMMENNHPFLLELW